VRGLRASFHLDREHEAEDRAARRRIACPVLLASGVLADFLDGSEPRA
jgi:hypothetical protein